MENEHYIERDTGVISKSSLKRYYLIKDGLHNEDLANKYLLAMNETVLGADPTPLKEEERILIDAFLAEINVISEKNAERYNRKVEMDRENDIENNKLDIIADLYSQGCPQREIAEILREDYGVKISQQAVSKRIAKIKMKYPELLKDLQSVEEVEQTNTTNSTTDTTNPTTFTTNLTTSFTTDFTTNPTTFTTDTTNPTTNTTDSTTDTVVKDVVNSDENLYNQPYNQYNQFYNEYNAYNTYNRNDNDNDNVNINEKSNVVNFSEMSEHSQAASRSLATSKEYSKSKEDFDETVFRNYRDMCPTSGRALVLNAEVEG